MVFIQQYVLSIWQILLDLSPALLLGLTIAGIIHVLLPKDFIRSRLSKRNLRSVVESAFIGVPMPLCSCGVVPTAIGLKNDGASKGATTSFLISTPQTGIDSILVSASFLGWPFAIFKLIAAFITGIIGGVIANKYDETPETSNDPVKVETKPAPKGLGKIWAIIHYAVFDLLAMIDIWLVVGILVAALITVIIPTGYLAEISWTQGITGMLIALAISMPLYVCTTSSVPIAASLIVAGMPLGTALVFLMAGPATNIATVGMIFRGLGGRVLAIYLSVVAAMSIFFGLVFDWVLGSPGSQMIHEHQHESDIIAIGAAILLVALMTYLLGRRIHTRLARLESSPDDGLKFKVEGMTCGHCQTRVKGIIEGFDSVSEAQLNLATGEAYIKGENIDLDDMAAAIEKAGYKVVK